MIKEMLKKLKKFKKENKETIDEAKDATKELVATYTGNVPKYLNENRNKIFDIIVQYHKGEISKEALKPILRAGFIILNSVTKEEQEEILRTCIDVDLDIKKDSDFTNDEFDIYREIINYIHSNRQKEVKILLKKAAQKLNSQELSISKETIDFITSITDEKLETLKKIFRYVVGNGILKYKDIEQDFMKMGFCQPRSDNIKFL
jgi:septum formation topological specificity factor MinE